MDNGPAPKLSELLRHPDDLDKIPALKLEFSRKKSSVDSQLRSELREQLETTQAGMTGLSDGQKTVQLIKDEMMNIDRLCSESQTMIKDFASINFVSQAHRNFGAVEAMLRNLESFNARLADVEAMLRQDDEDRENMPNLLPCHYELTQLRNIRDDAMEQIQRAEDPGLESTLEDYFARLDDAIDWFDEHIGTLALNLIQLVLEDKNSLIVRFAIVIEAEERSDRRVLALQEALKDHEEMAARFQGITDGAKKVRGYKGKFLECIRSQAVEQFGEAREEFLNDASRLEKVFKWYFGDLNAVKMGMTPLMPRRWAIAKTYADIYHALMRDFLLGIIDDPQASSAHTLEISSFPEKYYKKMAKVGFREQDLTPHVIDKREAELVRGFQQLIVKFLDEWIDRIFDQEKRDLAERSSVEGSNLDQDEYGYFRTKNLVALWRMLREQVDAAANSQRADVVEGVVDAIFLRLRSRQQAWQRALEDEALAYETGRAAAADADSFQALQDWLVATANDQIACIDDSEDDARLGYLSSFRQKVEPLVTPAYVERVDDEMAALRDGFVDFSTWCVTKFAQLIVAVDFAAVLPDLFTPRWYGGTAMKQMVATFDEYVADYRQVLHPSLVDIFIEVLADELLVRYLGAVRNKGARFRRADAFRDQLFDDLSVAFDLFAALAAGPDVADVIKQRWRVTEPFLALLSADRDALPEAFARFKADYPDLHLSWVEAVVRARDDFDRAMLNVVKARAALVQVERAPETIMARIK